LQYLLTNSNRFFLTGVILFAIAFIYWPIIYSASGDIRIVDAFNTDEVDFLSSLLDAYKNGSFEIGHYEYGLLYYNIGLIFFNIVGLFTPITEQVGVIIMRFLSCFYLIGTALVLRQFAKKYADSAKDLVFVLVLFSSITLINYGTMLHPDLAQVFFVALSLLYLAYYWSAPTISSFVLTSVFAGLAFSTKYVGIALLPILWTAFFSNSPLFFKKQSAITSSIVLVVLSVFTAFIANPDFYSPFLTPNNDISASILSAVAGVRILAIVFFFLGVSIFFYKNYVRRIEQVKWGAILSILSTSVFGLAFCIGSPQGIRGFNFLNGIVAVASVHKDGHWFRDETGLLGWLEIIVEPHVISLLWAGIAVVGLLFVLYRLITSERKLENGITLLPLAWLVVFCVVIVFRVKSHFAHYLIPILPFCFFYTAIGLGTLADRLWQLAFTASKSKNYLSAAMLLMILLYSAWKAVEYSKDRIEQFENAPELKAGKWLSENIDKSVFISADKYTYIPRDEQLNFRQYWGLSKAVIKEDNPDYLVINYHTYQWFLPAEDVDTYLHGRALFLERNTLYHELLDDRHAGFKLVADFEEVKIFQKR